MVMSILKKIAQKEIDLIVYDFDGVMTNNKVLVSEDGKEAVYCHRGDGWAISKIKDLGVPQVIISTEKNAVVHVRAQKLGIKVIHGVEDKKFCLIEYCKKNGYSLQKVVYIGNDDNDFDAMASVGYPLAPQDASCKVKDISKIIIEKNGGEGVIREFFETIEPIHNTQS